MTFQGSYTGLSRGEFHMELAIASSDWVII
jgi:hypothetical protein